MFCAEQPVHVADAGFGVPPLWPTYRPDSGTTPFTHRTLHPATRSTGTAGSRVSLKALI